jgi:cell division protein FtsN
MSREAELYKDKIEVSLDGRQIFYLFFGGSVIVGLVFVLGVMVGRRVEARGHTDRARVAATVDPLAALDRLEGGGGLSFQGALRGAEGPVSDVEKTIAALPKHDAKADKKPDDKKLAAQLEGKAEDKKVDDKRGETKQDDRNVADKKVDKADDKKADKADDKKAVEDKKLDKADAKKADKADAKTDKVEDKKADKAEDKKTDKVEDKKADKADDKKAEAKDDKKPRYTLQLSSFQDRAEAQAYLDAIKSAGYQAYVTEGSVDGKQYFRVRLGSYKSMEAASDAKAEFEKSAKKTAIVIKL